MSETLFTGAPRNALAVASLALGITGLVLSPLIVGAIFGLAGVILGLVALARGPRKAMATGGIVTGALALPIALAVAVLLLFAGSLRQKRNETASLTNLKRLSIALAVYGAEWDGAAPGHLANLAPYVGDLNRLIHDPRLPRHRPAPLPRATNLPELEAALDRDCDYWYAGAGLILRDPRFITFYDRGASGGRRLVAFADGHVEAFNTGSHELRAAVARNNEARAALKLPPLPLDLEGPPPTSAPLAPER
jgi:prepilin-type processing-associated H-X9-DG protein